MISRIPFENQQKFNRSRVRTVLVIHNEMELPDWMRAHARIINLDARSLDFSQPENSPCNGQAVA
jgi:hypothetical protein